MGMWQGNGCIMYILREFVGHNYVSGLCTLKPKNLKKFFKKLVFFQPCHEAVGRGRFELHLHAAVTTTL